MKNFVITIGLTILFVTLLVFQFDFDTMLQEQEQLKYTADECADTAGLFYDEELYADGKKVFLDDEANDNLRNILIVNMHLDNSLIPKENSYWKDKANYTVVYFDDSLEMREYRNGLYVDSKPFTYGYEFINPITNKKKTINSPTIVVTIEAGEPEMRLSYLENLVTITESSGYEYVGH